MNYSDILKQFDIPDWLIDNINDLDEHDFLMWLRANVTRLIEISLEFQDMGATLVNFHQRNIKFNENEWDALPF